MNILRHKKWHVRTKENVARVRRDEAKAAEEERARSERAALAEHEDRVRRLKTRASTAAVASAGDIFGGGAGNESAATAALSAATVGAAGHVNLFAELEEQERTNTAVGNREYAAERKKEQDDWESKVGIMKRFAEDTKEYAKESEWWQGIPLVREKVEKKTAAEDNKLETNKSKGGGQTKFMTEEEKRTLKKMRKKKEGKERRKEDKKERRKNKKRKRHHSSSSAQSSSTDSETEQRRKATKLDELRRERMVRERQEQVKQDEAAFRQTGAKGCESCNCGKPSRGGPTATLQHAVQPGLGP
ncbi:hypothetical protein niasHS_014291 [Heterodera schachtii]|uniref:CBF1-interacting co-repressor CIR N-terminal domain-containing protein n=1 Tax=Heterodera schachtii TaxID=97005 RepID=A0ABD2IBL6_HETSC